MTALAPAAVTAPPIGRPGVILVKRAWRQTRTKIGLALVALLVSVALFGPFFAPHPPAAFAAIPFAHPSSAVPLGADNLGRDVAALLLYGGRSSLQIGISSAVICCAIATVVALFAGFFGGLVDSVLSRIMDIIWAFPVYLLAISISTELLTHSSGFQVGPVHVSPTSLWLPTVIIAFIFLPYVYRPVRGQVLSVVHREFVEAAIAQGASNLRLIFSEILPNVVSTVVVFLPLMIATTILTESALSFLGIGVQPPNVSWGTIIQDGTDLVYTRPWVTIAPGLMILLTVLSLNVLGDGVRDALDPRAKLRVEG